MSGAFDIRKYYIDIATDKNNTLSAAIIKLFLWGLSGIYFLAVLLRLKFYKLGIFKSKKLPKPVLSIGNISWGGTGKTPFVIFLAKSLQENNNSLSVLTRGYGNDEQVLLKRHLPSLSVGVGKNRFESARDILKTDNTDVFLLDDGFQHLPLCRDVNIVLIDANNPFGNGNLIPRGILREPIGFLNRADIIVVTRCVQTQQFDAIVARVKNKTKRNDILYFQADISAKVLVKYPDEKIVQWDEYTDKNVSVFCGIGNPQSLIDSLESKNFKINGKFIFSDHYVYSEQDLNTIFRCMRSSGIVSVITTEKDIVRIEQLGLGKLLKSSGLNVYYPQLQVTLRDQDEFFNRLNRILVR